MTPLDMVAGFGNASSLNWQSWC